MILTYKQKHTKNFSSELKKVKQIAKFAVQAKTLSSKMVSQFGLKSIISNQILRKYSRNKKCKSIHSVNLIIPNQGIKLDKSIKEIYIPSLKLRFNYFFDNGFEKINQIEISNKYYFISVTKKENSLITTNNYVGVDLNTNGHAVIAANPNTGKVLKLGKKCKHIHTKYKNIRKVLQSANSNKLLKRVKHREQNIVKDLNHKMSHKLVSWAKENNCGIKFENLKGIRKNKKIAKSFKYILNSWSYYQLQQFVGYKAKLAGVPIAYVDPSYTSQTDNKTGLISKRNGFVFTRIDGKKEHSGVNAAFNISLRQSLSKQELDKKAKSPKSQTLKVGDISPFMEDIKSYQSIRDRDRIEGNTDIPQGAML